MACTGPLYTSINQISTINSLTFSQKQDYTRSWNTFRSIELYNSNVSTQRGLGNADLEYWKYKNYDEISAYQTGEIMFFTYLGYGNTVQKN